MRTPQPIPYQGSKRALAPFILNYFPEGLGRLIEPFAGSAAVSIAAAMRNKAKNFIINDINESLIDLLKIIINEPAQISSAYEKLWNEQLGNEKEFFLATRERFNKEKRSDDFLYVLARCIKGAVRYNANGDFNQSADNRRKGKNPINMKQEIFALSNYLIDKTEFHSTDYSEIFAMANEEDLIYMDPPYQGTCKNRDPRYYSGILFDQFVSNLELLNQRNISYLISYDGKTGDKTYGEDLPDHLNLKKIMIEVGRSTQSTLLGQSDITYEALYLSDSLVQRIGLDVLPENVSLKPRQLELI